MHRLSEWIYNNILSTCRICVISLYSSQIKKSICINFFVIIIIFVKCKNVDSENFVYKPTFQRRN